MSDNIKNKADFEACWAGAFVYLCQKHLTQLETVGLAMGSPVNSKPCGDGHICKNCKNENK